MSTEAKGFILREWWDERSDQNARRMQRGGFPIPVGQPLTTDKAKVDQSRLEALIKGVAEGTKQVETALPKQTTIDEKPSNKDIALANSETIRRFEEHLKGHKRRDAGLVAIGVSVGLAGGVFLDRTVFADEPISEFPPASSFIDSPPASLTDTRLVDDRLPRAEGNIVKDFDPSNAIKAHGFSDAPPRRTSSEDVTAIDQLPIIKEHTQYADGGNYNNFIPGITFRLEKRQPVPYTYKDITPNGLVPHTIMMDRHPFILINGYVVKKELNPEGNIFLAIEIPGKNGFFTQDSMDKPSLSADEITDNGNGGKISNTIVWLEIKDFKKYSQKEYSAPFIFNASWNEQTVGTQTSERNTNIPQELFKYTKVGDPILAIPLPQLESWAEKNLTKNYKEQKNRIPYDEAIEKYSEIVGSNTATIQKMLEDAKTGGPSLREQLKNKTYVFEPWDLSFVPR